MEIKIQIECIKKKKDNNYPRFKVKYGEYREQEFDGDLLEVRREIKAWLLLQSSELDVLELLKDLIRESK